MPFAKEEVMRWISIFLFLGIGCGNSATVADPDLGVPPSEVSPTGSGADMGVAPIAYGTPQGGPWTPPPANDSPVTHAAPSPLSGAISMLAGVDVLDVSTDNAGGIWAVSASTVYYFPPGAKQPITYDQSN